MRDDPYPARFYAFPLDEPFSNENANNFANDGSSTPLFPIPRRLQRILLLLLTIYLGCAIFLILTVSSYAAPRGDVTISPHNSVNCLESTVVAAH